MATVNDATLWQNYIQGITADLANPQEVMAVSFVPADFAQKPAVASAQVYKYGNTIPNFGLVFSDSGTTFFSAYSGWLEALHPPGGTGNTANVTALMTTLTNASNAWTGVVKAKLREWNSGMSATGLYPNFKAFLQAPANADVVEAAINAAQGAQSQYNKAAEAAYGAGYLQLSEAQQLAQAADPYSAVSLSAGANTALQQKTQMTIIGSDGSPEQVPRFGTGVFTDFQKWLTTTEAAHRSGAPPTVQIAFSSETAAQTSSSWAFSVNATIPLESFFSISASGGASSAATSMAEETYSGTITFQDVTVVDVAPDSSTWFQSGLLSTYANFSDWPQGSQYAKTPIWGPHGILRAYVTQLIVGYAPSLTITFQDWSTSQTNKQWQASTSFNIGPFPLAGASAGGSNSAYSYKDTGSGISYVDRSGIPKIIGAVIATPNWSQS